MICWKSHSLHEQKNRTRESRKPGGGANIDGCNVLGCERGFGSETQLRTTSCCALSQSAVCAAFFFSVTAGESRGVADSRGESGKERCHCCCQNAAFGHQYARCYHSEVRAPRYSHKQSKYVQRGRRPKDRVSVLTLPVVSLSFARFWASDGTFNNTWL